MCSTHSCAACNLLLYCCSHVPHPSCMLLLLRSIHLIVTVAQQPCCMHCTAQTLPCSAFVPESAESLSVCIHCFGWLSLCYTAVASADIARYSSTLFATGHQGSPVHSSGTLGSHRAELNGRLLFSAAVPYASCTSCTHCSIVQSALRLIRVLLPPFSCTDSSCFCSLQFLGSLQFTSTQ